MLGKPLDPETKAAVGRIADKLLASIPTPPIERRFGGKSGSKEEIVAIVGELTSDPELLKVVKFLLPDWTSRLLYACGYVESEPDEQA